MAPLVQLGTWHRLPPPWATQNPRPASIFSHPSWEHRPPPCARHRSLPVAASPRSPPRRTSSWRRRRDPCTPGARGEGATRCEQISRESLTHAPLALARCCILGALPTARPRAFCTIPRRDLWTSTRRPGFFLLIPPWTAHLPRTLRTRSQPSSVIAAPPPWVTQNLPRTPSPAHLSLSPLTAAVRDALAPPRSHIASVHHRHRLPPPWAVHLPPPTSACCTRPPAPADVAGRSAWAAW